MIGGRLCLDFANTSSGRGTPSQQDHLKTYGDLLAWAHHAGALDRETTLALAELAARAPAAAQRTRAKAIALREALFSVVTGIAQASPPPPASLAALNTFITAAGRSARLETHGGNMQWTFAKRPLQLDLPLSLIAWSAADVLTTAPAGRLKTCAGVACGWVFLDQTKNGRRRWCEMEVCGSRAKMRRLRARRASPLDDNI